MEFPEIKSQEIPEVLEYLKKISSKWPQAVSESALTDSTATFNGRASADVFFSKSGNSQDNPVRVWHQPPTQFTPALFPLWEFIMTDNDYHILFDTYYYT